MSDVQTSPAPAVESAPSSSGEMSSGAETATDSVESPVSSGLVTENSLEASPEASTLTQEGVDNAQETLQAPEFDPESWDGNLDSLPEHLQKPVSFLHRQLESGYTKKFQSLADERKAFDAAKVDLESAQQLGQESPQGWQEEKGALERELNLLRNVLDGVEDPRIAEYHEKSSTLETDLATLKEEFEGYKDFVQKDITAQADKYAEEYRSRHAAIFDSEEKRMELATHLDTGWDPEAAAKLVGQNKTVVALANQLMEAGTPAEVAVEHAVLKHGGPQTRAPRPGARLTSGAESRNNPESINQDSFKTGFAREDRMVAARAAMNWRAGSKLK